MSVEITLEQVQTQLSSMGFIASDFVITSIISIVKSIDSCLDKAGYSEDVTRLIKLYSVILMLSSSDVRKVSSESSPSGSSRSYSYFEDGRSSLIAMLDKLDIKGCTGTLPIVRGCNFQQFTVVRG